MIDNNPRKSIRSVTRYMGECVSYQAGIARGHSLFLTEEKKTIFSYRP